MRYLLAVTGSIASYKSYDLARLLVKNGHAVKVVLTQGALEFIQPNTFRYLGVESVHLPTDDFRPEALTQGSTVLHVELAKWADQLLIAPLSANTLSKLCLGLSHDLLGSLFLAFPRKPILLFPAMNTAMWESAAVRAHVASLAADARVGLVNPVSGLLACGDVGAGKFPDVAAVADLAETWNPLTPKGKKIIVTAGATAAPLDPVRYLTNPSTGSMGIAIAKAFLRAGHEVTLLAGHHCRPEIEHLNGHPSFRLIKTPTTEAMKLAALEHFPAADLYVSTGAIADIEFDVSASKLKKEAMGTSLPFHQAADILKEILELRRPSQKIVSFAAETQTTREVFLEKMRRKPVDLMVGNEVANGLIGSPEVKGFQRPDGEYYFVRQDGMTGPVRLKKDELGIRLVDWFEGRPAW